MPHTWHHKAHCGRKTPLGADNMRLRFPMRSAGLHPACGKRPPEGLPFRLFKEKFFSSRRGVRHRISRLFVAFRPGRMRETFLRRTEMLANVPRPATRRQQDLVVSHRQPGISGRDALSRGNSAHGFGRRCVRESPRKDAWKKSILGGCCFPVPWRSGHRPLP